MGFISQIGNSRNDYQIILINFNDISDDTENPNSL
jgi:hypothetical protein